VRFSASLLTVAGTVAGTAAAVVAYQATAASGPATRPASVSTEEPAPAPAASTSWLPCEHGWKAEGTTCVRVKHKVVVVHDLPAQAAAPARSAGVRAPASVSSTHGTENENETEHGDENEVEHADDANEDTQHVSEPGDDDGPDHEDVGGDD
jgi:hypothetical protein